MDIIKRLSLKIIKNERRIPNVSPPNIDARKKPSGRRARRICISVPVEK
jgi:hypothetical protein